MKGSSCRIVLPDSSANNLQVLFLLVAMAPAFALLYVTPQKLATRPRAPSILSTFQVTNSMRRFTDPECS